MQILLPMAGNGSRFRDLGYNDPKPLIDVKGQPMIERVIENLGYYNDYTFVVREDHWKGNEYRFRDIFSKTKSYAVKVLSEPTDGAARTCLKARDHIDPTYPMMIANCDQVMEWDKDKFYKIFEESGHDGMILTFRSVNPAHSYVKLDQNFEYITEVAEKVVISEIATVGVYTWEQAGDFFEAAEEMIRRNIRTNNEFYVAPATNVAIERGARIKTYDIRNHYPIGTPEQLGEYLDVLNKEV